MRFLLDENVQVKVGKFLEARDHDVLRVPAGIQNGAVIRLAVAEARILLTQDKDFLDAIRYPPQNLPGIICVRIHPPEVPKITAALDSLPASVPPAGDEQDNRILECALAGLEPAKFMTSVPAAA